MGGQVPCVCCSGEDANFEVPPYETAGPSLLRGHTPSVNVPSEPKLPRAAQDKPSKVSETPTTASTRESLGDDNMEKRYLERADTEITEQSPVDVLAAKVSEGIRRADLELPRYGVLEEGAHMWCSQKGFTSLGQVREQFDELCVHLQLSSSEERSLRSALDVPLPQVGLMSLRDVASELALDAAEFGRHFTLVSGMRGSAHISEVVEYLHGHGILFTAAQVKQIFDVLLPRATRNSGCPYNTRSQLVMALHCFCVEPYILWEDDGHNNNMWLNLTYDGIRVWDSGLCEDLAGRLCTDSGRPVSKREEGLRRDISGIRFALEVLRASQDRDRRLAMKQMVKPKFHGIFGDRF